MIRLLGIDPGSRCTGWGVIEFEGSRMVHVAHGVIRPPAQRPLAERLDCIYTGLDEMIRRWKPEDSAIEQVFAGQGVKSALVLGQARGVALLALQRATLPVSEYAPAEIKLAVAGHGRASKEQLARMVGRLLGIDTLGIVHDATDALAIAICHLHGRRRERLVQRAREAR